MLVPWLIITLAKPSHGHQAPAGRLKAAAMQLLPALLDSLHARRLSGAFGKWTRIDGGSEQMNYFMKTLVSTGAASVGCSICAPWSVHCSCRCPSQVAWRCKSRTAPTPCVEASQTPAQATRPVNALMCKSSGMSSRVAPLELLFLAHKRHLEPRAETAFALYLAITGK